jgi:hypothetical protein
MVEDRSYVLESMAGINEVAPNVNICQPSHYFSNVKSVHEQCDQNDVLVSNKAHLQAAEVQALLWKIHNKTSICWSLFVINDNLHVDLENPQMLSCIIYRSQ